MVTSLGTGQYHGDIDGNVVFVDTSTGEITDLPMCLELRNHSPTGFAWGYNGSGPSQLALAILMHTTEDKVVALHWYHQLKNNFLLPLSMNHAFVLDQGDVLGWLLSQGWKPRDQAKLVDAVCGSCWRSLPVDADGHPLRHHDRGDGACIVVMH